MAKTDEPKRMGYVQFWVRDWLADGKIELLSNDGYVVYHLLFCRCWEMNGLPSDRVKLAKLARVGDQKAFDRLWDEEVSQFFKLYERDGQLVLWQPRLLQSLEDANSYREKKAKAAAASLASPNHPNNKRRSKSAVTAADGSAGESVEGSAERPAGADASAEAGADDFGTDLESADGAAGADASADGFLAASIGDADGDKDENKKGNGSGGVGGRGKGVAAADAGAGSSEFGVLGSELVMPPRTWGAVLDELRGLVRDSVSFETWCRPLRGLKVVRDPDGSVTVVAGCPSKFWADWVRANYLEKLVMACKGFFDGAQRVVVELVVLPETQFDADELAAAEAAVVRSKSIQPSRAQSKPKGKPGKRLAGVGR